MADFAYSTDAGPRNQNKSDCTLKTVCTLDMGFYKETKQFQMALKDMDHLNHLTKVGLMETCIWTHNCKNVLLMKII